MAALCPQVKQTQGDATERLQVRNFETVLAQAVDEDQKGRERRIEWQGSRHVLRKEIYDSVINWLYDRAETPCAASRVLDALHSQRETP
jgi:plasmid stabilization system protein ParE